MKPGLRWACLLCPDTSSAVAPALAPHHRCTKAMSSPCPLCLSTMRPLAQGSWESCRVSRKGSVTPAHHFPPLPAGKPPHRGDSATCRCAGGTAAAERCEPHGGFLPSEVQGGRRFLPLRWLQAFQNLRCTLHFSGLAFLLKLA